MKRSDKRRADTARRETAQSSARETAARSAAREGEGARVLFFLVALSAAMLLVRSYAASRVGFGDSEALYATYALHPQPAYLDHPGLVGMAMRSFVDATAPYTALPAHVHATTALLSTLVPWVIALAARLGGASWARAGAAALVVAVVPEISVGLFALTPDLLLAFFWPTSIGLALFAIGEPVGDTKGSVAWAGALFLAGAATSAKVSGALLLFALVAFLLSPRGRPHARSIGPWVGLAAAIVTNVPVVLYEASHGWPMVRHRLIDTQTGFGPSLRNVAAVIFGQLGYLGPIAAIFAVVLLIRLARAVRKPPSSADAAEPETVLLSFVTFVPLAVLLPFSLLSRVAEAHWIAPALLGLPIFAARPVTLSIPTVEGDDEDALAEAAKAAALALRRKRRLGVLAPLAFVTGALMTIAAHLWVLVPASAGLLPEGRERELDIANELYGWPQVLTASRSMVDEEALHTGQAPIVVAPHWVLSAQLAAGLGPDVPVACDMDVPTDFDQWVPRDRWSKADSLVVVTDGRFPLDLEARYPAMHVQATRNLTIFRGGRAVRNFRIALLYREALGFIGPAQRGQT